MSRLKNSIDLVKGSFTRPAPEQKTDGPTDNDNDLDNRTKLYYGDFYDRLQKYPVLVVGAGAVGTETIKNLIMMGIRKIYVVDFDKVSLSNLNRCIFFKPEDHGNTYKVHAIVREARSVWQNVEIIPYPFSIQEAPEEIWDAPIVITAVDNNQARYYVNMRALSCSRPPFIVNGAMGRTFIEVQVLLPGYTSCLVCTWNKEYADSLFQQMVRESCDQFFHKSWERFPSISVLNSIIGGIISGEVAKILIGLDLWRDQKKWEIEHVPLLGQSLRYDISSHEFSVGKLMPNPACVEVFFRNRQAEKV